MTTRHLISLLGAGEVADERLSQIDKGLRLPLVSTVGLHDPRAPRRGWLMRFGRGDASLTGAEYTNARDLVTNHDHGAERVLDKAADVMINRGRTNGHVVWVQHLRDLSTEPGLRSFHQRLPRQRIIVAVEVPDHDERDVGLRDGYAMLERLHQDDQIIGIHLSAYRAPFSERWSPELQRLHLAAGWSSLLTAEVEPFWQPITGRPIWRGLRSTSKHVAPHPLWFLGAASLADVVEQAKAATEEVLAGGDTRTIEMTHEASPEAPVTLVYTVPFPRWDRPRWRPFIEALQGYVTQKRAETGSPHTAIVPHFVSGNGAPVPGDRTARLRVGVSLFHPLVGVPRSLDRLLESPTAARESPQTSSSAPDRMQANGHDATASPTSLAHAVRLPTSKRRHKSSGG